MADYQYHCTGAVYQRCHDGTTIAIRGKILGSKKENEKDDKKKYKDKNEKEKENDDKNENDEKENKLERQHKLETQE